MWCVLTLAWELAFQCSRTAQTLGWKSSLCFCISSISGYHLILFCAFCTFLLHRGCTEITKSLHMAHPGVNCVMTWLFPKRNWLQTSEWSKIKNYHCHTLKLHCLWECHYTYLSSPVNLAGFSSPELPHRNSFFVPLYWEMLLWPHTRYIGLWIPHAVQTGSTSLTAWIMQLSEVGKSLEQR